MAENALKSGKALERLRYMIELQGGNSRVIEDYSLFKQPERSKEVFADKDGFISGISCEHTGMISLKLGAGRKTKESEIDPSAGIVFDKTVGDSVKKGDRIAVLYTSSDCDLEEISEEFGKVIAIDSEKPVLNKNIIKIIKGY